MADTGVVPRQRLFDLVAGPPKVRVLLAPSGFGKTTLLESWAETQSSSGRRLVWVALTAGIRTRRSFWQLVGASAARRGDVDPATYKQVMARLGVAPDPVTVIAELLDACGPTLVVLDAYEHVRDVAAEVDADIVRLAATVDALEFVVTTRAATRLSDEVLVMRGAVRVIDDADLRFTADEVERLLDRHAPHATASAERIALDTRGYPLGVRAVTYALRRLPGAPAFDGAAWRRLVTEDLRSQIGDPRLLELVLDTSVPPYFDRELARQLSGTADVDQALTELAWNGFGRWIPYAREHPVFQYVDSVRDVVRGQLRVDQPERYRRAAGIAAAWLQQHSDPALALTLAIDGRDYGLAARICRSLAAADAAIYTSDLFERQLRRVPSRQLPEHPVLAFMLGMAYSANSATRASAPQYFRIAAEHALDRIDQLSPGEAFAQHLGREVCLRYLGRSTEAGAEADTAVALLDSMPAADRDGLGESVSMGLSVLAYSRLQVGDVDRAGALADRAATMALDPWWKNYALGYAAGLHALNGRGPDARAALASMDPLAWAGGGQRRIPHALGLTGEATLRLDDLDFDGATHAYDAGAWLLDVADSWPFITWVLAHARLGMGEAEAEARRIEAALATSPPPPGLGPNLATAALRNALAILWLAAGNAGNAGAVLRGATPFPAQLAPARLLHRLVTGDPRLALRGVAGMLAEQGHTIRSAAAVDTLGAVAAQRGGDEPTALKLLERAATRHQRFGVRAQLLYVPHCDLDALRDLAARRHSTVSEAYLAGPIASPIAGAGAAAVVLTPREIEVLRAWARLRTRTEVANALFVSTNTVRTQLSSAYRKLGVTTKDAAIQRAIELDLFGGPQH